METQPADGLAINGNFTQGIAVHGGPGTSSGDLLFCAIKQHQPAGQSLNSPTRCWRWQAWSADAGSPVFDFGWWRASTVIKIFSG